MNDIFLKSNYIYSKRQLLKDRNSLSFTQNSPLNKTLFNSSNSSRLSTNFNSSESFLFQSLYINQNIRNFKMKNIKLKNKIYSSSLEDNFYQKYIQNKLSNNITKLKLPKMNLKREYFSPPPKTKIQLSINNNDNQLKENSIITTKNKDTKDINTKISFIGYKIQDELFDILNCKSNCLGSNNYNNKNNFKESIQRRALIQKYIYEQKNRYKNDVKNEQIYKKEINNKEKKIKNIYNKVSNDECNILSNYNLFLQRKIHDMKELDYEFCKKIESLKSQVKNLFIKIKIESDRLWSLFDIRNFLVCVKESISIRQLPLIFRLYNSDYLDELSKINENDIYLLEKMEKPKKNMNLFRIPTNLIMYINALSGLHKETIDKRFLKYLDCNYIIFNTVEEFIEKYILTERNMLDHLRNSLQYNTYNQSQQLNLKKQIDIIEKDNKIFEDDYNKVKKVYEKTKNVNGHYEKIINNLSSYTISEKNENDEDISETELENRKFLENEKQFKNNELFLKMIQKKYNIEKNHFMLKFNELKNIKKFRTEKEYVYYFIIKNLLQLFKIYPEYFYIKSKYSYKRMNKYINNIKDCHKLPNIIIQMNVIYLLSIYEAAINNFLIDYQKNLEKYSSSNYYQKLKRNLIINKKSILFKQQSEIENKVKKMKFEKYNKKHTKYRYRQRNVNIIDPLKFKKANSMDNKIINQKEGLSEEKDLLIY